MPFQPMGGMNPMAAQQQQQQPMAGMGGEMQGMGGMNPMAAQQQQQPMAGMGMGGADGMPE